MHPIIEELQDCGCGYRAAFESASRFSAWLGKKVCGYMSQECEPQP
jgi:hypothetical protein